MINQLKQRYKNYQFYVRIVAIAIPPFITIVTIDPATDLSSWGGVFDVLVKFLSNPYLIASYIYALWQSFKNTKSGVK